MPTEIIIAIGDPETGHSMVLQVQEEFERVMNILMPLDPPTSHLAARQQHMLTKVSDGLRVAVDPRMIAMISEVSE